MLISTAMAATGAVAADAPSPWEAFALNMLLILVLVIMFYVLLIMPQQAFLGSLVIALLHKLSLEVIDELSARDPWAKRIQESFYAFLEKSAANQRISEQAYLDARNVAPAA